MIGCLGLSYKCKTCHWRVSSRLFIQRGCNVLALLIKWASRAFLTDSRLLRISSSGIRWTSLIANLVDSINDVHLIPLELIRSKWSVINFKMISDHQDHADADRMSKNSNKKNVSRVCQRIWMLIWRHVSDVCQRMFHYNSYSRVVVSYQEL